MDKEVISNKQMQLFIFSFYIGAYLLFGMGAGVKQHAWIASAFATLLSIPIVFIYGRIMELYPGKNIFDIIEIVFGKIIGTILNLIVVFNAFFLGSYILKGFSEFIKITALSETPVFVPKICIGILSIWILNEGIEVLAAWSKFLIRIALIFLVLTWILLIPQMEISNLYPILYKSFKNIFKESILLVTFPFTEVFIFLTFFDYVDYNNKTKNIFIKPLLIAGALVIVSIIINLMSIGGEAYSSFYYPGYEGVKMLRIQGEFQRVEVTVALIFAILRFLELNFCFLGMVKGITKVFNLKDYKSILTPSFLLMMNFSFIMFKNVMEAFEFIQNLWPVYGIIIQIIFPIIILIGALIKKKYSKKLIT